MWYRDGPLSDTLKCVIKVLPTGTRSVSVRPKTTAEELFGNSEGRTPTYTGLVCA